MTTENPTLEWKWFIEWASYYEGHMHGIKRIFYVGKTKYQHVEIIETYVYGKCLVLDGKIQSSQADEWIYHESLVHPVMITHPKPKKVAVLGGGEGATLREVLRYPSVERVVMVDIDEEVIKLCKKYLPEWHQGSFDDPRVELVIEDARRYLQKANESFDVIIIDLTDPVPGSPSVLLYTKEFYQIVRERLTNDGLMVTQATNASIPKFKNYLIIYNTLKHVFPIVRPYYVYVPSFISAWGFVIASKKYDPIAITENQIREKLSKLRGNLKFYDEQVHRKLFILPKYIKEAMKRIKDIATDEKPVYLPV